MVTLYCRNAGYSTINGLTTEILGDMSSTSTLKEGGVAGTIYWAWDIFIRHSNGSETLIGEKVGLVSRSSNVTGLQTATWDCPQTSLATTDSIRAIIYTKAGLGSWVAIGPANDLGWITENLASTRLNATTWIMNIYTGKGSTTSYIRWGNSSYLTSIENISLSVSYNYSRTITEQMGCLESISRVKSINRIFTELFGPLDGVLPKRIFKGVTRDSNGDPVAYANVYVKALNNLLNNGSFETSNPLLSWNFEAYSGLDLVGVTISHDVVHGKNACQLTLNGTGSRTMYQSAIAVAEGDIIRIWAWVKAPTGIGVRLGMHTYNPSYVSFIFPSEGSSYTTNTDWVYIKGTLVVPIGSTITSIRPAIQFNCSVPYTPAIVDGIVVTKNFPLDYYDIVLSSDASGNYEVTVPSGVEYYIRGRLAGSPNTMGCTDNI